jgi:hypothetical protein
MNAFCPQYSQANKEITPILITTSTTAVVDITGLGPDLMISVRSNPMYFRFGNASTTVTASGTAGTQGMWLPTNSVIRIKKPQGATHIATLQDTGAAQVFIQPGDGI